MARYRVDLSDRAGNVLGVLPPSGKGSSGGLQYSTVLNGGGSATVTPSLTLPLISGENRDNLDGWASEIIISRIDGPGELGPVYAGPVTKPHADLDAQTLTVASKPVWAWLEERLITADLSYLQKEQTALAADLIIRHTAGLGPAGDIRLGVNTLTTGRLRDRPYLATDNKTPGSAVTDLTAVIDGFDFDVILTADPTTGRVSRTWQPYYPYKGRQVERPLTKGRGGLRMLTYETAEQVATRVYGYGAGDGAAQLRFTAQASAAVEARYGIHQRPLSATDVTIKSTLVAHTQEYLRNRTPPAGIITFQYSISGSVPFGEIQSGDSVRVQAERGWLKVDEWVRVIGLDTAVGASGEEVVTCTAEAVPDGLS